MNTCPCGSKSSYEACCGLYIDHNEIPPTAETLMRSRYTAFTKANVNYLANTMKPPASTGFNKKETKAWAQSVTWLSLTILKTEKGMPLDAIGWVEFIASYRDDTGDHVIHERSEFKKVNNRWYYTTGVHTI